MNSGEEPGAVEREIRSLEAHCEELADAIDEFEHDMRRCRDRQEREGDGSHRLAREMKWLRDNRDRNRRDLEEARRRIAALKAERGT